MSNEINIPNYGSASFQSPVSSASALPTSGNNNGDIRVALDTGLLYVFRSSSQSWVLESPPISSAAADVLFTGAANGTVYDVLQDPLNSDRYYVYGNFGTWNGVSALQGVKIIGSTGATDGSFSTGTGTSGGTLMIQKAIIDSSGNSYITGFWTGGYNGNTSPGIAKIDPTGAFVSAFNVGTGLTGGAARDLKISRDGLSLFVVGTDTTYNGAANAKIVKLNLSNASQTAGFSTGTNFTTGNPFCIYEDASGNVYVGGSFTAWQGGAVPARAIKLDSTGTKIASFNSGGAGFNAQVNVVIPVADGSGDLYWAGGFATYNGQSYSGIIRLRSDGSINTSFNPGAAFDLTGGGIVSGIINAPDGSGDIYAIGNFVQYQGNGSRGIVRIKPDGSINTAFITGTGFALQGGQVMTRATVIAGGSGDIFVNGDSLAYNGTTIAKIARINSKGAINTAKTNVLLTLDTDGTQGLKAQLDPSSNLYNSAAIGTGYQLVVATEAGTTTINNNVSSLILKPAAGLTAYTITMPSSPFDGQLLRISSSQAIAGVTHNGNTGQTISGAITALSANGFAAYQYVLADTKWYRNG